MPVDVDKKVSFNHSILCCGRTLTNPSSKTAIKPLIVLVKRHKKVLEIELPKNTVCIGALFCLSKHIL